jgi:hypothetical protein
VAAACEVHCCRPCSGRRRTAEGRCCSSDDCCRADDGGGDGGQPAAAAATAAIAAQGAWQGPPRRRLVRFAAVAAREGDGDVVSWNFLLLTRGQDGGMGGNGRLLRCAPPLSRVGRNGQHGELSVASIASRFSIGEVRPRKADWVARRRRTTWSQCGVFERRFPSDSCPRLRACFGSVDTRCAEASENGQRLTLLPRRPAVASARGVEPEWDSLERERQPVRPCCIRRSSPLP